MFYSLINKLSANGNKIIAAVVFCFRFCKRETDSIFDIAVQFNYVDYFAIERFVY